MTILEYCLEILKLNQDRFGSYKMKPVYFCSVFAGLAEEILEYIVAAGMDADLKEAGDVLAYTVLSIACIKAHEIDPKRGGLNKLPEIAHATSELLEKAQLEFYNDCGVDNLKYALYVVGSLKRFLREDRLPDVDMIAYSFFSVLEVSGFTLSKVAEVNIEKLTGRLERGTLFKGMGER